MIVDALAGGVAKFFANVRPIKKQAYRFCECIRIGRWHSQTRDASQRDERYPGVQLGVHYRLAASHGLELHDSKSFTASSGWQDEHIRRMIIRRYIRYGPEEGDSIGDSVHVWQGLPGY